MEKTKKSVGSPKILLYDLETAPILGYTWGMYEQNILKVVEESYILCFAYKWLGEKNTNIVSLDDFPSYKRNKKDDKALVKKLHELMDESDILIAQNGDRFDQKWSNKRFIKHGLKPVSPYKSIDTLKVARKHFRFDGNNLDRLGEFLGLGRKEKHRGVDMWFDVMDGDKNAWSDMEKYAKQDVILLEQVYFKLRPWIDSHPNLNQYNITQELKCPACKSYNIQRRGYAVKGRFSKAPRFVCKECGRWATGRTERIPELEIN